MSTKAKPKSKKPSSTSIEILKELKQINESIDDIYDLIQSNRKKDKKRRVINGITGGMLRVFGILLATVILSGAIFLGGKFLIQSDQFQSWLVETTGNAIKDITVGTPEAPTE